MFTSDRIAIEKFDGTLVVERCAPRDSFSGHHTLGSAATTETSLAASDAAIGRRLSEVFLALGGGWA
jgi:hypothetical protein